MNFLILSVTAGEGHNSTAKALCSEFARLGAESQVLDTFKYASPAFAKIISEGYLFVTENAKSAFRIGYSMAEKRKTTSPQLMEEFFRRQMADELAAFIDSEDFDAIIFTHSFAGMILDVMKERGMIKKRTLGILTDFTFHPYWENCTLNDYVVTPDRLLLPQARRKGFRDEQIIPLGIPINPKFSSRIPKETARRKLGLDESLPTFLIMGGSMGYGNIIGNVKAVDTANIDRDFQMIVVCGNNAEMKEAVDKYSAEARHRILVTGFVDYVSTLMDAADCIITKPGGLTTSESLAKGLPMIIINPIPGQEERNTEFLLNNGCAIASSKTCPLDECIYQLLTSETHLETMRRCISEIAKPTSTEDVCRFLINLAHTPMV